MGNNEVPGGIDGMGSEVEGVRVETVPDREGRIERPRTEMIQGKFGLG